MKKRGTAGVGAGLITRCRSLVQFLRLLPRSFVLAVPSGRPLLRNLSASDAHERRTLSYVLQMKEEWFRDLLTACGWNLSRQVVPSWKCGLRSSPLVVCNAKPSTTE